MATHSAPINNHLTTQPGQAPADGLMTALPVDDNEQGRIRLCPTEADDALTVDEADHLNALCDQLEAAPLADEAAADGETYVALPPETFDDDEVYPEEPALPQQLTAAEQRYPYDPAKQWYVLRVSYGRGPKAHDFLGDAVSFFPTHREVVSAHKGRKVWKTRAFLPNLLFVYTTPEQLDTYVNHTPELSYVSIYYDHFRTNAYGRNLYLTVPYAEMTNFINLMLVGSDHTLLVDPEKCHLKSGDPVRVIAGEFAGIEGRVARIAGQQRVVVELSGICLAATAYVPTAFLMRVGE